MKVFLSLLRIVFCIVLGILFRLVFVLYRLSECIAECYVTSVYDGEYYVTVVYDVIYEKIRKVNKKAGEE